jgi:hypothetical protein
MSMELTVIELLDEPILVQFTNLDFDSLSDPQPFDANGKTVSLELRGADGVLVDTSGKVSWFDQSTSKAQFARATDDLVASNSPYRARWIVTDTDGMHPYPSTSAPQRWDVVKVT